jgi:tRNA modification GTPase
LEGIPASIPLTIVSNKIDLSGRSPSIHTEGSETQMALSVKKNLGLDVLRQHLKEQAGLEASSEGVFLARRRHLDALKRALQHLEQGAPYLKPPIQGELLAEELRLAQEALSEITGEFRADDLLGEIFSSFCIGK